MGAEGNADPRPQASVGGSLIRRSANGLGDPAADPHPQRCLLRDRRFGEVVLGAALRTGLAGAILFWRDTNDRRKRPRVVERPDDFRGTRGGLGAAPSTDLV